MLTLELDDHTAELLEQIVRETGKSQDDVVADALELYLKSLSANRRAEAAIAYVRDHIHPKVDPAYLGRAPTKEEQEEMLGM